MVLLQIYCTSVVYDNTQQQLIVKKIKQKKSKTRSEVDPTCDLGNLEPPFGYMVSPS